MTQIILVLLSVFSVATIALCSWILLEVVGLKINQAQHAQQLGRLVSDAESEKDTRKRSNHDFDERLRKLEQHHP